ncbi:MAG: hypothetical protein SPI12_00460 [Actinomycetaceae bacterium]|nr:hypothetical protein [Actinomycetaceae bacterium]MDY6082324.1 hypothetical protein [Actinomycetaceae bacterium]
MDSRGARWRRIALTSVLAFVTMLILCIAALTAAYALPHGRIASHVSESLKVYQAEGDYPNATPNVPGGARDNFTEAIMLTMAIYPSDHPFHDAFESPRLGGDPQAKGYSMRVDNLAYAVAHVTDSDYVDTASSYARYWHGYLVVLRPLLLLLNPVEIRYACGAILAALGAITAAMLWRRCGAGISVAYIAGLIVLNPPAVMLNYQYYPVTLCALVGVFIVCGWYERLEKHNGWIPLFLLLGAGVAFTDLLTFPVLALGMPLLVYAVISAQKRARLQNSEGSKTTGEQRWAVIVQLVTKSCAWAIGYIGFWAMKWVLAALIAGHPMSDVGHYVLFRLDSTGRGEDLEKRYSFTRFQGIENNLHQINNSAFWSIIVISLVILGVLLLIRVVKVTRPSGDWIDRVSLLMIAAYPFVWYAVILNHSAIHSFFTYRSLGVTLFALYALASSYFTSVQSPEQVEASV